MSVRTNSRPAENAAAAADTRLARYDWTRLSEALDERGFALMPSLLTAKMCQSYAAMFGEDERFRRQIHMARHGYGQGTYKYFSYPLPDPLAGLRTAFYARLAPVANRWNERLGIDHKYPAKHAAFLRQCHAAGQVRPTPLLLEYGPGDYNCLHQDLYGELAFPLQVAVLLSDPAKDFAGGEFILTEQRPRRQSRAEVVPLSQGDAVIFANNQRPMEGARGPYRVTMRHGVSRLHTGRRHTLGLIFHDAT